MLPAATLFNFLRKDFARAWDAMALAEFDTDVGGNFMFARQAMVLLELAWWRRWADRASPVSRSGA